MSLTLENLETELAHDDKVKVAGFDVDGILRGKIISKKKFLSVAKSGFGFCSVIFGWDMHDQTYFKELTVSNAQNGYRDIIALVDLESYRRIPWEVESCDVTAHKKGIAFFLLRFLDPDTKEPVAPCPRGFLRSIVEKLGAWSECKAMAGAEYEFYNFSLPPSDTNIPRQPITTNPSNLEHLTPGMFGYSTTRPVHNSSWYYKIWENCKRFRVDLEGWHTESGPGVYEAALEYCDVKEMADRAGLFKYVVKSTSAKYGIVPCFMAKPRQGLPGNSGHVHLSLQDNNGINLFAAQSPRKHPRYSELDHLSPIAEHFLAGILHGLPDIMPLLAPTINSYKRLVENFWAPVTVSWGLEHRSASIRVIAPPIASRSSTRFEIRTPGADANPHLVLGTILGLGLWGLEQRLDLLVPPLGKGQDLGNSEALGQRLPKSLKEATERFMKEGSVARKVFGDAFVDHFGGTREHEIRLWEEAVTDWEIKRYIETV